MFANIHTFRQVVTSVLSVLTAEPELVSEFDHSCVLTGLQCDIIRQRVDQNGLKDGVADLVKKLLAFAVKRDDVWSLNKAKENVNNAYNILAVFRHFHNHGEDKVQAWKAHGTSDYEHLESDIMTWSYVVAFMDKMSGVRLAEKLMGAIVHFALKDHPNIDPAMFATMRETIFSVRWPRTADHTGQSPYIRWRQDIKAYINDGGIQELKIIKLFTKTAERRFEPTADDLRRLANRIETGPIVPRLKEAEALVKKSLSEWN